MNRTKFNDGSSYVASPIQTALNSMNCDTTKPITVGALESSATALVCCVHE